MPQAPIYYSDFTELNQFIEQNSKQKYFFIVDNNTHEFCLPALLEELVFINDIEIIEIPDGESSKEIEIAYQVWQSLLELGADRNSIIINCGGGVVTDFGGFIASTFKRGIRFINTPTTLLSMVDASVGGKTGVNLGHSKNQVGTFAQPEMVIIHPDFLETLSPNQMLSGFAEMLKHGLIKSKEHWGKLVALEELNPENLTDLIQASVSIKKEVVEQDPTEKGLRKILNAGHTLGHALESWYLENNQEVTHGEGVALGLILESYLSKEKGILSEKDFNEIFNGIKKFYPKQELPELEHLLTYLKQDKKNQGGAVQFILLDKIGHCTSDTYSVEQDIIQSAFDYYRQNY